MYNVPQDCHIKGQGDWGIHLPIPISYWLKGTLGSVPPPRLGTAPILNYAGFPSLRERTRAENKIAVLAHPWGESLLTCVESLVPCTESMRVAFMLLLFSLLLALNVSTCFHLISPLDFTYLKGWTLGHSKVYHTVSWNYIMTYTHLLIVFHSCMHSSQNVMIMVLKKEGRYTLWMNT